MKHLSVIILVLLAGCSSSPNAIVIDTRKGDSGFLFVDIRFPDGHREGVNLTVGDQLIERLKQENDSLKLKNDSLITDVTEINEKRIELAVNNQHADRLERGNYLMDKSTKMMYKAIGSSNYDSLLFYKGKGQAFYEAAQIAYKK